jgi:hypothetical protein
MTSRKATAPRRLLIDDAALALRKPRVGPLVDPAEAVAIALSMLPSMGKHRLFSPDGPEARTILLALKLAGWKQEPI